MLTSVIQYSGILCIYLVLDQIYYGNSLLLGSDGSYFVIKPPYLSLPHVSPGMKSTLQPTTDPALHTPTSVTSPTVLNLELVPHYTFVADSDLAGKRGEAKKSHAVRRVMLLNWRGIAHTAGLLVATNTVYPPLPPAHSLRLLLHS
jgi:hypothetical protein